MEEKRAMEHFNDSNFVNKQHYKSFEKQITEINLAMQASDLSFSVYASRTVDSDKNNLYEAVFCKGKDLNMEEAFVIPNVSSGFEVIKGLDTFAKQTEDKVLQENVSYCFYSLVNNFKLIGNLDHMRFEQDLQFNMNSTWNNDGNVPLFNKFEPKVVVRNPQNKENEKSESKVNIKPVKSKDVGNDIPPNEPTR